MHIWRLEVVGLTVRPCLRQASWKHGLTNCQTNPETSQQKHRSWNCLSDSRKNSAFGASPPNPPAVPKLAGDFHPQTAWLYPPKNEDLDERLVSTGKADFFEASETVSWLDPTDHDPHTTDLHYCFILYKLGSPLHATLGMVWYTRV